MGLFPDTTDRHLEPELMDSPALPLESHGVALRGLARINTVSRSAAAIWSPLRALWAANTPAGARVLDLACGGGDVAVDLRRRALRDGVALRVDGCDVSRQAVGLARKRTPHCEFFRLDALGEPLPSGYDAIVCNLFLHHLPRVRAAGLLRRMSEAAPVIVVNDLVRGAAGYAAAYVGTRLLSRSPIVHIDGPRSVRSAFTLEEARDLAGEAGLDSAVVRPLFPLALATGLDAMTQRYDVVTIGAGPAGALSAHAAARSGLDVLLVDRARFPRDKVCGCCLNARALGSLESAGLGDLVPELGAENVTRLTVRSPSGLASLPLQGSASVSRRRFDSALVERARRAGATFSDGVAASLGPLERDGRGVRLKSQGDTREVRAGVVVVADGLAGSALRTRPELRPDVMRGSRIGAGVIVSDVPSGYSAGEISLACGRWGYVGTVRLEDGSLDVAAALAPEFVREAGGPGAAAARILGETESPTIPGLAGLPWRGTPALTRRRAAIAGERFFVVGDAAAYVEPFTGEGIAWALEGALELSRLLPAAVARWDPDLERRWVRRHRALARRRQWGCRAVAALLRRPRLTRGTVRLIGRVPRVVSPLLRHLTQPLSG